MDWALLLPMAGGIARAVLASVGGYMVAKGYADPAGWDGVVGSAGVVVAGAWSMWQKWMSKK